MPSDHDVPIAVGSRENAYVYEAVEQQQQRSSGSVVEVAAKLAVEYLQPNETRAWALRQQLSTDTREPWLRLLWRASRTFCWEAATNETPSLVAHVATATSGSHTTSCLGLAAELPFGQWASLRGMASLAPPPPLLLHDIDLCSRADSRDGGRFWLVTVQLRHPWSEQERFANGVLNRLGTWATVLHLLRAFRTS